MCNRLLSHNCLYKDSNKIVIISHDYLNSTKTNLSSSINDVTIVWNYLKRKLCFNENQIIIFGEIDIDGKMIPWRKRYNKGIPPKNILYKSNIFYYTGHGYSDGKFDTYNIYFEKDVLYIIDACYSYMWPENGKGIITSSNGIENFISLSTKRCSYFTNSLFEYLGNNNIINLKEWAKINNFKVDGNYIDILSNNI